MTLQTYETPWEDDALNYLEQSKWGQLQQNFLLDYPRGIPGYYVLETQHEIDFGMRVHCPGGKPNSGMVIVNEKGSFYEVIIQCPSDDTSEMEEALKQTSLIDWSKSVIVPFAPDHIIEALQRVLPSLNVNIELLLCSNSFVYYKNRKPFKNTQLPQGVKFDLLKTSDVELVNSVWPHRYAGSNLFFKTLIDARLGFGLYQQNQLISWMFIYEVGTIGHMYTLEQYRRKGYSEALLKLVCNDRLSKGKDAFAFTVIGATPSKSCQLFR